MSFVLDALDAVETLVASIERALARISRALLHDHGTIEERMENIETIETSRYFRSSRMEFSIPRISRTPVEGIKRKCAESLGIQIISI